MVHECKVIVTSGMNETLGIEGESFYTDACFALSLVESYFSIEEANDQLKTTVCFISGESMQIDTPYRVFHEEYKNYLRGL